LRNAPCTPLLLLIGFIVGLILILLGIQVMNWVNDVVAHWHGGDGYVSTLDTDVGHGGTSHFLAFYQNNTVIIIECSSDYSSTHTYAMKVSSPNADHHAVTLDPQVIDGRHDLLIMIDGNQASLLYNTGNSMSFTPPGQ